MGDRGTLTEARIREEVKPAGLDRIGALRGLAIRKLAESGTAQLPLFDGTDLVEVRADAYPGERLMACRNPLLADERARRREELLDATEELLEPIMAATRRGKRRLRGGGRIGERVRAHVLLCMLAHYVEWHMRRRLAPLLFDDEDPAGTEARRTSVVAPARASDSARRKARTKRADEGRPVHGFRSLLRDPGDRHEKPRGARPARRRTLRRHRPTHRTAAPGLPAARRATARAYPVTNRRKPLPSAKINTLDRIDSGSSG